MITIKEIAKISGLSPSTVSIVLNGKAEERKISSQTVKKIQTIASEHGYMPNTQAIGLRIAFNVTTYRIMIFWTADFRVSIMLRFIKELENRIMDDKDMDVEILLKPYKNDHLREAMSEETIRSCNGMIICNASAKDMKFIENSRFIRPIVLYNRYSHTYPCITMNDKLIGRLPAEAFAKHGCRHPAIVTSVSTFSGMDVRNDIFETFCVDHGMERPVKIVCESSRYDGFEATKQLMETHPDIDSVFYSSDDLAQGALRYFLQKGIEIPGRVKIITIGYSDLAATEMSYPSLSVVNIPIEEAAGRCLEILVQLIQYREVNPLENESLLSEYIPRESCPKV